MAARVEISEPLFEEVDLQVFGEDDEDQSDEALLCAEKKSPNENFEESDELKTSPSFSEVLKAWETIKKCHIFHQEEGIDKIFDKLDNNISRLYIASLKDTKITDFFNPKIV